MNYKEDKECHSLIDVTKCRIEDPWMLSSAMSTVPPAAFSAQVKRWKDKHYLGHRIVNGRDNWNACRRGPKVGLPMTAGPAFGPWNVQRPLADIWTSNGAQLCQSNSSGLRIYWLSRANRATRAESKTRFSLPYRFLLCQSWPYESAREKEVCCIINLGYLYYVICYI